MDGVPVGRSEVRVLVADDNAEVLGALVSLLDSAPGVRVVAGVSCGADALAEAARLRPDVALLDVRMPGGGAGLVRELRAALPGLRVVALTASPGPVVEQELRDAGAEALLVKGAPGLDVVARVRGDYGAVD